MRSNAVVVSLWDSHILPSEDRTDREDLFTENTMLEMPP
jgi:hypothetical protein